MPLLRTTAVLLALCAALWANVGEITLIKGEAIVKRVLPEVNATAGDQNATEPEAKADSNATQEDQNATKAAAPVEINATAALPKFEELNATVGMALLEGDTVLTRAKGAQVRIRLADNTQITVGGNSEFKIETLNTQTNEASLGLVGGTLRTITGQIGKIAPERFKVKTRTATIGIRGTDFVTALSAEGAVESACLEGAIGVATEAGEVAVPAGQMTTALPGAAPAAPVAITAGVLGALFGALGFDEDEAAEAVKQFTPPEAPAPVPAEENNETNVTAPVIVPIEENLTVLRSEAGLLLSDLASVTIEREADQPVISDQNRTLLEGDKLLFVKAGHLKTGGGEIRAGEKGRLSFAITDGNSSIEPLAIEKGVFVVSGLTGFGPAKLGEKAKALVAIEADKTTIVSLEGTVASGQSAVPNLMLLETGKTPREYEAKELITLFEAAGLSEAEAKPYLPKPKAPPAPPKPKIYKF